VKNLPEIIEMKKTFPLFGKEIDIVIYDIDDLFAEVLFKDIYQQGLRLQKIFNFFDSDSELSKLNIKREMKVSDELLFVIKIALNYCRMTDGLYDISKGKQILQRKSGNIIEEVSCSYKDILVQDNTILLKNPDVLIDLGSIAKGYIVDKLIEYMDYLGLESGFIDARGDMRNFGSHAEIIGIQHPRDMKKIIRPILLENFSVATSGDYNQYDKTYENSHIIGKSELISVSVAANNLMEADAIATCVILLGKERLKNFLGNIPQAKIFMIDTDLNEYMYNGFELLLVK
jgi:thiamine biosynthesis lipoprotein